MSGKWEGGFITTDAPNIVPPVNGEGGSASGIWTLNQMASYEKQGLWPRVAVFRKLYAFGLNFFRQLGLGDTTNRSSPTQVGVLTTWLKVAAGYQHSLAVKTDGTLWSWGNYGSGRLGLGINPISYSSPVQVGGLTNWAEVSAGAYHSLAIKTDGTLWTWGDGAVGQLGHNNTTTYSSPKQVGTLTTWSQVSAGRSFSSAVKSEGTAWAWGEGSAGRLGLGSTVDYSSPVQIGALTNWLEASANNERTMFLKTNGTLWGTGQNVSGALGQGNNSNIYSSPVQVGSETTWSILAQGSESNHALAITAE